MITATFFMKNKSKIVLKLLPEKAPNTVASFVHAVKIGVYNDHAIQRIVPRKWIDLSYDAFGKKEAKYLLPDEFKLHPEIQPLPVKAGYVCMGGYGELGLSGCEVFFPLTDQIQLTGTYPVFAKVIDGMDELKRLEKVKTHPVEKFPYKNVEVNEPIKPEIIDRVVLDPENIDFPLPIVLKNKELPKTWQ